MIFCVEKVHLCVYFSVICKLGGQRIGRMKGKTLAKPSEREFFCLQKEADVKLNLFMGLFGSSIEQVIIKIFQECGLPNPQNDYDRFHRVVNAANDLLRLDWGNKEASVAGAMYFERTLVKIESYRLYDTYDDYVSEDKVDEILLSYLNSEQKNIVRNNAKKMLRQAQMNWQNHLRNMNF